MRLLNAESSHQVVEVNSEDILTAVPPKVAQLGVPKYSTATPVGRADTAASATATPLDTKLARFWDTYVWYHKGGEDPGRYRIELFANGILTTTFDYTVGTIPIASPEPALA